MVTEETADYSVPEQVPVHEALRRVKQDLGVIGKGKHSDQLNYAFRKIEDIIDAAHESLLRHGVTFAPRAIGKTYEVRTTANNKPMLWASVDVEWIITGPMGDVYRDPEGRLPCTTGEAADTSDKATNKAHTAAFKVVLSQVFAIPYTDHDDQDSTRHELANPRQQRQTSTTRSSGSARATQGSRQVPPLPAAVEIPALWAEAKQAEVARAEHDGERIDNLTGPLYGKVVERITKRLPKSTDVQLMTEGSGVDLIKSLPPTWLPVWRPIVDEAVRALDAQAAPS